MSRHDHRVDAGFRARAMGPDAFDMDIEKATPRHHRAGPHRELAHIQAGAVMHAVNHITGKLFEQAVFDHGGGAADTFLRRLEYEMHLTVEIHGFGQIAGRPQQHSGMAVVAAGMHLAVVGGTVGEAVGLQDRQGIHIRPQADGARGITDP